MQDLKKADLSSAIYSNTFVVIDFWAPWCAPCKLAISKIHTFEKELKDKVTFYKVNIDEEHELASELQIKSLPTFFIYKNGEKVKTVLNNADLLKQALDELIQM
jgi:thioredoxin 1